MTPIEHRLTVSQLLALARQSLAEGRPDRMAVLLRPLLQQVPREPRARLLLAQATLSDSPLAALQQLQAADPQARQWAPYWALRARAEARLGRPGPAAASARRALVMAPARIDTLFDEAFPIAVAGTGRAGAWLDRWAAAAPLDAMARLAAAQAAVAARRGNEAFAQARRALLLSPAHPLCLIWLVRTGISADGVRELATARRWLPAFAGRDSRTVAMVAQARALSGDLADAAGLLLSHAPASRNRPQLLANAAGYLQRMGRHGAARATFRQALVEVPGQLAAIAVAQSAAERRHDYAEAYRWQARRRVLTNRDIDSVRAAEMASLTVYRALLPRLDLDCRTHRLIAAHLLAERQGAYHVLDVAPGWDHRHVAGLFHRDHEVDPEFCSVLWALAAATIGPAPGRHIVDIGPADGLVTVHAAVAGAAVTAIESTSLYAERTELFARLYGVSDRVSIARGAIDGEHLPLLRSADFIVCLGVLYHLVDVGGTVGLLARSGRPLLLETRATDEDWPDASRGRLHSDRLPVSWPWLVRTLERAGYAVAEIVEWHGFLQRRTGTGYRRMLVARPAGDTGAA